MAHKPNIEKLFRKNLGKRTADALIAEMDRMIREKKSAVQIEKMLMVRITSHIEERIVAKITPLVPSDGHKIRVAVHSRCKPMISVFQGSFVSMIRVRR